MKRQNNFFLGTIAALYFFIFGIDAMALNNPHVPSGPGPWFEGWYTRITDVAGERSIAVIVGSHLPPEEKYKPGACLPGYIQILLSEGNGAPVLSYEAFPQCTYALVDGQPVVRSAGLTQKSNFEWVADGFGTITEEAIDMELPGAARVSVQFSSRLPWNDLFGEVGPEGLLAGLPLPMHWHVYSLGSDAQYQYEIENGTNESLTGQGIGYAHQEKNWGKSFPQAWAWLEGISAENRSQLVVGGGKLAIGPLVFRPWILGYHSPSLSWDFNFAEPGTVIKTDVNACEGILHLTARTPMRTLEITASAPLSSYGEVGIPTAEGFISNGAIESFSATIEVKAYQHTPWGGLFSNGRLVEEQTFTNAVLEFGADYKYCR